MQDQECEKSYSDEGSSMCNKNFIRDTTELQNFYLCEIFRAALSDSPAAHKETKNKKEKKHVPCKTAVHYYSKYNTSN